MDLNYFLNKDLDYFFSKMKTAFKPLEADGIEGVILFLIQNQNYILEIRDNKCKYYKKEETSGFDTLFIMEKEVFVKFMLGIRPLQKSFNDEGFEVKGNLDLATAMELIFEHPLHSELWFYQIENTFNNVRVDCEKYTYCFKIERKNNADADGISIIEESPYAYRYVQISEKKCEVTPHLEGTSDTTFKIKEELIFSMLKGEISIYDAFLTNLIEIEGKKALATEFPRFFKQELFPNKSTKLLTVESIFNVMPKMVEEIPEFMQNKVVLFCLTGKGRKYFFVSIKTDSLEILTDTKIETVHTKIEMSEKIFIQLSTDKLTYVDAFDEGEISIKGNSRVGIEFNNLISGRFNYGD